MKFNTKNFLKIIEKNRDILIQETIQKFLLHIKSHSCVKSCIYQNNSIQIQFIEDVVMPKNIEQIFITGGFIKKTSALKKDKVDEKDFFYIRSFKQ